MAHLFDNAPEDARYQIEPESEPKRRRWVGIVTGMGLALFGVAAALLWHSWSDGLPMFPSAASEKAPAAAERTVGLTDFQTFQQQISGTMQSTSQMLGAQQAEIKRLSEQVAALTAKIDTLQPTPASAQAAIPATPPPAPAAPRKRPIAAKKPAPAISVGGAPLPQSGR